MTEAQTFNFELVSPEQRLLSTPAHMVVIPGDEGDFGVLAGHSSLVAAIRPGVVEVYVQENDQPQRIFIAGGFADVTAENCTVLAEEAVNVNDMNKDDLEQALRNLQEDMSMAAEERDKARILKKIKLTKARIEAITGHIEL